MYLCPAFSCPCGEMVDTLVSGASASRRVGSTPIMGTLSKEEEFSDSSSFCFLYEICIFAGCIGIVMKEKTLKISALLLSVWYCFSVIGFDVHTCRASGRSFVATVLNGLSCSDIHPEHVCRTGQCAGISHSCCDHENNSCGNHAHQCCNEAEEENFCGGNQGNELHLEPLSCCSNDYQALTLTGCTSDDTNRHNVTVGQILLAFTPCIPALSHCAAPSVMLHEYSPYYRPGAGGDVQSLLNIWRI